MRSQQQADREEQQRIKSLVLNYEASTEPEPGEGESYPGISLFPASMANSF
jgi:regulator of nonsense transcripts 2